MKTKITTKGYLVILVILLGIFTAIWIFAEEEPNYKQVTYIVQQGDTLDGIATKYCNPKQDKRKYIYEVMQLNGRSSSIIYTGETIKILKEIER